MTPSIPPASDNFEVQVLTQLDQLLTKVNSLDDKVNSLDDKVAKLETRLDGLFNGLVTVLVSVITAASLLIVVRNGLELWFEFQQ
jgi:predicted nuclease with TOPRIM domain